ncbi:TonB-dependent receptor [Govanella unica]|uniref:TonB-dependent receptor n=1 Tax=Govanella unica TaxID=2975056 RepID=A0A9X3TW34_9PROT|nr:TonB-dependent receptor [Govania unica]MDA5192823.1 TonB-dependent receptor [Govania unica]
MTFHAPKHPLSYQLTKNLKPFLLASVALSGFAAPCAMAAPATDGRVMIEEVMVTATRRAEPLQKVPIAVSVISGDVMLSANLNNLRDVSTQIPSLNFRTAASNKDQALFLRGIGTISTSPGVEPSTSTVIDGVVMARQGQATLDLMDIDSIEVLRGPQGTLFGKNSSAGVLNIITKRPTQDLTGFIDAAYYNRGNEYRVQGGISGGLVEDKLAGSVTALYGDYQGNVTNVFDGSTVNGYTRYGGRAKLLFTPNDDLRILLSADYMHTKDTTPQGVVAQTSLTVFPTGVVNNYAAFATALRPVVASLDNREINSNFFTHAKDKNYGFSGQIDYDFAGHTLTSITAYRQWTNLQFQDQDRLPGPLAAFPQQHDRGDLKFHQISQELRLASPQDQFIDYVVGLFYFHGKDEETYRRDTTVVSGTTSTTYTGIANFGVTNSSYAAFGEGNVHFTDKFRATAGVRVMQDKIDYDFARVSTSPTPVAGIQTSFSSTGKNKHTDYSSRLGLQFDVTPDAMTYFTYARGYKGAAYNLAFSMLPQDTGVLKPETSNAFEIGLKSKLFGGAVIFNIDAYLDKLKNYQVPFFDIYNGSQVTRLINAGKVSTRGVEAEMTARPTEELTLTWALAYTKARVDEFKCPVGTAASCQINGRTLPFAPTWRSSLRANYAQPLTDSLTLNLGTDINWQTKIQYSLNQTLDTIQQPYAIWNATIGLETQDGWAANFLIKNITNKSYSPYLQTFGSGLVRFVPRDDRRYFGVNLHKNF